MPRGKAESDLAKAHPPCHWLDLPRLPLLRILEIVHATSSVRLGSRSDAAPQSPLSSHSCSSAVLLVSALTTLPLICQVHRDGQQMLIQRRNRIPLLLTSRSCSQLQNPACVCRSWHTAAHEIRLGDTASSRPARYKFSTDLVLSVLGPVDST